MTREAADLRSQHLLRKKPMLKQSVSITSLLFPGSEPIEYSRKKNSKEDEGDVDDVIISESEVNGNGNGSSNSRNSPTFIPMFVEYVESRKTPVGVEYSELPVCPLPEVSSNLHLKSNANANANNIVGLQGVKTKKKNLGQRLMGQSSKPLGYQIHTTDIDENNSQKGGCTILCHVTMNHKQLKLMRRLIRKQYRVHYTLDSLPILVRSTDLNHALRGYPLGFEIVRDDDDDDEKNVDGSTTTTNANTNMFPPGVYLNNHLRFTIYYNTKTSSPEETIHITGFDVSPVSIEHTEPAFGWDSAFSSPFSTFSITGEPAKLASCDPDPAAGPVMNKKDTLLALKTDAAGGDLHVVYSYEVTWKLSDVEWPDRWDIYMMETPDNDVHYFAIVNSLMIGFLLCGTVAIIMIRALRKDITKYNEFDIEDYNTPVEESGWKLIHADVFRPPKKGRTLLSVAVGTGLQIGTSVFFTLVFAVLRLLNPMKKGQLLSYVIILYVFSGSVAGYASAKLFKFFTGRAWKRTTFLTAAAFPAVVLSIFITLNLGLYISMGKVSTSVSFSTVLIAFLLWVCVSTPLVFVGSYFGYKQDKIEVPTKTNQIARFIPESRSWFVQFPQCALLAGVLPFGSVVIELSFIMGALWLHQIYYIMGFIMVVCGILTISCSTVSMVFCYIQLCNENHKWWWRSFYNCASIGFFLFVYSMWYLVTKLEIVGIWPFMVYSVYMGIISFACALYCGGVGVVSSFWFVRKIYAAVKVD
eukprot:CAMPEP_0203671888 /NCGR_PEP_ID=MMETSP0090-20130426/7552_1 /ASSEMBLY_ACC=CAM_ASM_001088 /TAXON_ID=426623 /ORGANISM="Chaetoceros affinis, Strain CCMP159" /LENGTH=752 /DNA_ID=CAMNT_0050537069 /DNA_START=283 /DNA_END=2541 /DNA_ORIENTATION=-